MQLPDSTLKKIDKLLGTVSQPHRIWFGEWLETDCLAWHIPTVNLTAAQSQQLNEAFARTNTAVDGHISVAHCGNDYNRYFDLKEQTYKDEFYKREFAYLDKGAQLFVEELFKHFYRPERMFQNRNRILSRARELVMNSPVIAYKGDLDWVGVDETTFNCLVIAPTIDQFEILRIERTYANNRDLTTEQIIARLKQIDDLYGIDITGASSSVVEFTLKSKPTGREARELKEFLLDLAPDIYTPPFRFSKAPIALWWD